MTFILGTSRLTYDFLGTWTRRIDCHAEVRDGAVGDPSWPGSAQPGTFMLCDEIRPVRLTVATTQEQ